MLNRLRLFYQYCFIYFSTQIMVSAFSVPKAKRQEKYPMTPGPGRYNPENSPKIVKNTDPLYSFGKDSRKNQYSSNPGPGAYQPKQDLVVAKKPSFSMLSRRDILQQKLNVGPGQYSPSYNYGKQKQPSFSMRPKFGDKGQSVPGPGNYEYKSHLSTRYKGNDFGRQSRVRQDSNKVPGPGSYQYQKALFKYQSKQEPSYGFGSRLSIRSNQNVPGPGAYQPKKDIYSRIGGKLGKTAKDLILMQKTPGPGAYEPMMGYKEKYPSWSLSKSQRDDRSGERNNLGPGQYDHTIGYKKVIDSAPAYGFHGRSQKLKYQSNQVPGPGTYQSRLISSRKSIRIAQKLKDLDQSRVPGPGAYEDFKYDKQGWLKGKGHYSMGKNAKLKDELNNVPGPGSYENKSTQLKSPKGKIIFGRDQKIRYDINNNPGPGHYDLKPTFADVPKYLLP